MSEWLLLQEGNAVYVIIFILLSVGAVIVPEDIPLIGAGVFIEMGKAHPYLMLPLCYFGVMCGDTVIFLAGRYFGPALFKKEWFKKRFNSSKIRRVRYSLEKRSLLMILLARHLFYLRTLTFLVCGAVRMSTLRFFAADAFAALISVPVMVALGFLASHHLDTLFKALDDTKIIVLVLLLGIGIFFFVRRKAQTRLREKEEGDIVEEQ